MAKLTVKRKTYRRKAYSRKAYTIHRNGKTIHIPATKVKPTYVPATTYKITDRGAPGRGKKLIRIKPGELIGVGYSTSKPARARRIALAKAVKKYGAARVWHMLHAQVILRKRTGGTAKAIFVRDRNWVKEHYGGPTPRAAIRKWKRMSPTARAKAMPGGRI